APTISPTSSPRRPDPLPHPQAYQLAHSAPATSLVLRPPFAKNSMRTAIGRFASCRICIPRWSHQPGRTIPAPPLQHHSIRPEKLSPPLERTKSLLKVQTILIACPHFPNQFCAVFLKRTPPG